MKIIKVEQIDVNSENFMVVNWLVPEGCQVSLGQPICEVETTKATLEVPSPGNGKLVITIQASNFGEFNKPIGYIAETTQEFDQLITKTSAFIEASGNNMEIKATKKARQLAGQYGIDLHKIVHEGLVTEKDIYALIEKDGSSKNEQNTIITKAGPLPKGLMRVLVLGAGLGAMQVIDILLNNPYLQVVGALDDDPETRDKLIFGVPVLGKMVQLNDLWQKKFFDQAIISISTNITIRKTLFEKCKSLGISMVNAVDPSARINRAVVIGEGNVICSLVHLGVATVIGDNNFISSHTSIEHHNVWGSHNTTGPNCATSSRVKIGNEVKFGTGIFLQPGISIGDRCFVASGSILTQSVPADHIVKTQITQKITPIDTPKKDPK